MNINGFLSAYTLFMDTQTEVFTAKRFSTKSVTFRKCDLSIEVANSGEIIKFIICHFHLYT